MRKFRVEIPEERVEVVNVVYEVEAENEADLVELIQEGDFMYSAEYVETKPSRWGFEVKEVFYDDAIIEEVEKEAV
jgi:hypothetical protein